MIRQATEAPRWTPEAAEVEASRHRLASPASPAIYHEQNVGLGERIVSGLLAGGLASVGLNLITRRGGILGILGGLFAAGTAVEMTRRAVSGHSRIYQAAGIRADDAGARSHPFSRWVHAEQSITIAESPQALYERWRDLASLPRFMTALERVEPIDETQSHWTARDPRGRRIAWDAVIVEDVPGERLTWRSVPGGDIATDGEVRFKAAPRDRGTEVIVRMRDRLPGGLLAAIGAQVSGHSPAQQLREDLRRLKSLVEAGEVPTTIGQPRGTCG